MLTPASSTAAPKSPLSRTVQVRPASPPRTPAAHSSFVLDGDGEQMTPPLVIATCPPNSSSRSLGLALLGPGLAAGRAGTGACACAVASGPVVASWLALSGSVALAIWLRRPPATFCLRVVTWAAVADVDKP